MILTLVRGLPGSGKSTYAAGLGCFHVEDDMFRMQDGIWRFDWKDGYVPARKCTDMAVMVLYLGYDVVVSNCLATREEIEVYERIAKVVGASLNVVRMTGQYGSIHDWDPQVVELMKDQWADWPGEIEI